MAATTFKTNQETAVTEKEIPLREKDQTNRINKLQTILKQKQTQKKPDLFLRECNCVIYASAIFFQESHCKTKYQQRYKERIKTENQNG